MSSQRVIGGYKTKVSTAVLVSPQEYSGSNTLQQYEQGVYINDINILIGSAVSKLRPNNDFLKVKMGVRTRMVDGLYDDTEAPTSLALSGTSGSIAVYEKSYIPMTFFESVSPGQGTGEKYSGVSSAPAPSHYNLDNDFGQPDYFQDGTAYEERDASLNPLWIIEVDPAEIPVLISEEMVNSTEMTSIDGVIDPFSVRKEADRSFTEIPFRFKGVRGDLVNDNVYRRSAMIFDEQPTVVSRLRVGAPGTPSLYSTDPFLDAGDELGLDDLAGTSDIGPVNLEGYLMPEESIVSPFKESDDNELTVLLLAASNDAVMRSVVLNLSGSNNFPTHDFLSRDHITLGHGFVYDNNYTGVESLAFGGLLK
jgi:hypothetical protein